MYKLYTKCRISEYVNNDVKKMKYWARILFPDGFKLNVIWEHKCWKDK